MRLLSLAAVLFAFWLALSGHYTTWLLTVGVLCTIAVVFVAWRMGIVDSEGHPVHLVPRALTYFPWLALEIVKSAWGVTKVILHPRLPISPTMTVVKASQRTSVGIAAYADSITLTPGTITVGASGNALTVHALVAGGADDLEAGRMDARVVRFEGQA